MDVWNMVNYLNYEQAKLNHKFEQLSGLVKEVLEAVIKNEELKKKEKFKSRCRYYNRGYCKKGSDCSFFHPNKICQEHLSTGACSQWRECRGRHPYECRDWLEGNCWRNDCCDYLHKNENYQSDVEEDGTSQNLELSNGDQELTEENDNEGTTLQDNEITVELVENDDESISAEEIIKMYENVEMDLDVEDISVDDIMKMYESESENVHPLRRSKRKTKERKV